MNNAYLLRLCTACLCSLWCVVAAAQNNRQIEVTAINELDEPLREATVLAWPAVERIVSESMAFEARAVPAYVLAQTDSQGKATVDVSKLMTADSMRPVNVAVWKPGYGPQKARLQDKATLQCWPLVKRTVQILSADNKPMPGVRIKQLLHAEMILDVDQLPPWTSQPDPTNEFGLTTIEACVNGRIGLEILEPPGASSSSEKAAAIHHQIQIRDVSSLTGRIVDPRDVTQIRLTAHGQVAGKLPKEFARETTMRLVPANTLKVRRPDLRSQEIRSQIISKPDINDQGEFRFQAVAEGSYWLVVYPHKPFDSATDEAAKQRLKAIHRVEVHANETAQVEVRPENAAKVSGRVIGPTETPADYSDVQVAISQVIENDGATTAEPSMAIGRAQCAKDGSFECWLPTGQYELMIVDHSTLKQKLPVGIEVGSGAATISAPNITALPWKTHQVRWKQPIKPIDPFGDAVNAVFFQCSSGVISCQLTDDGYGQVRFAAGDEVQAIVLNASYLRDTPVSIFEDKDPGEDYELELIRTPQGKHTSIGMHGRVVDAQGKGLAHVPVTITLAFERTWRANGGASFERGKQLLKTTLSERDGTYSVAPRQLFNRVTIPGATDPGAGRFTFRVSTPANPEPIEVVKTFTVDPSHWEANEIEFPDLVLDQSQTAHQLSATVLNADGSASAGELVELADRGQLVRQITNKAGQFSIGNLNGRTWLFRKRDWSIRSIDDYQQPLTIQLNELKASAAAPNSSPDKPGLSHDEQIALAKDVLKNITTVSPVVTPLGVIRTIPDEFYLEREKAFQQLLLLKRSDADALRFHFANYWRELTVEQIQQLVEAMSTHIARIQLMRFGADRDPSREAYEKVMDEILAHGDFVTTKPELSALLVNELTMVATRLAFFKGLDDYRSKIRQFLEPLVGNANRKRGKDEKPSMLNPKQFRTLSALLDPEQFADELSTRLQTPKDELSNEDRGALAVDSQIYNMLYPSQYKKLGAQPFTPSQLSNWGAVDPLGALEAYKDQEITLDQLRMVSTTALISRHPDAEKLFLECLQGSQQSRIVNVITQRGRPIEMAWYEAARHYSPDLRHMAAWALAHDWMSGRYDENLVSNVPAQDRHFDQMLMIAFCLRDEFPALSQELAQRAVPNIVAVTEREFNEPGFRDTNPLTLLAWVEPKIAYELLLKLDKLFEENKKNDAKDPKLQQQFSTVVALRDACLRSLLTR